MIGAIRTRDVVFHPFVTIRCFGWKTFFRAIMARRAETFLSLLHDRDVFGNKDRTADAFLRQCFKLELRAKSVYCTLAETMCDRPAIAEFLGTLAEQEQEHADLLQLCRAASNGSSWELEILLPWRDSLDRLDREMDEAEAMVPTVNDVDDVMRLVLQIELSEVNHVFLAAMTASNSTFVKNLRPFQTAVETHIAYIASQVSELAPWIDVDLNFEPAELAYSGATSDKRSLRVGSWKDALRRALQRHGLSMLEVTVHGAERRGQVHVFGQRLLRRTTLICRKMDQSPSAP